MATLRIRCPQCRTILQVQAGARPSCPQCGFAGHSGVEFTSRPEAAADGGPEPPAEAGWTEAPAQEWQPVDDAAASPGPGGPVSFSAIPKRRGLFGRR